MPSPEKKVEELTEEDIMSNDLDPLEAINQIRRDEGVDEEDLMVDDSEAASQEDATAEEDDGSKELDEFDKEQETDEEEAEADAEADSDAEEDPNKETSAEEAEVKIHKFSANGQDFEFTEEEMVEQFASVFGKAADYTNKTKALAPYRKMVSALESEDITTEQLNLAIDALKGNKDALQELLKRGDVDALDIDTDAEEAYQPKVFGKTDVQIDIEEVTKNISGDEEYPMTVNVIDQQWDDDSREALSSNPEMIQGLHNDIKSGMYAKVAPIAMKMQVTDRNAKSSLEYYMLAGQQILEAEQESGATEESGKAKDEKAQTVDEKFDKASSEANRKRSSSSTRQRSDRKGVIDYLDDDNDEEFDAWYKKTMESV